MKLSVDAIKTHGGFTGGPVKRVVEWDHNGEKMEADVWIRPMSYHTAVSEIMLQNEALNPGEAQRERITNFVLKCVCHDDGSPVFTRSDITGINDDGSPVLIKDESGKKVERGPLNQSLSNALFVLIGQVSGLGKE